MTRFELFEPIHKKGTLRLYGFEASNRHAQPLYGAKVSALCLKLPLGIIYYVSELQRLSPYHMDAQACLISLRFAFVISTLFTWAS